MPEVRGWQSWEVLGFSLPNPELLERVMATENLLFGDVNYEVETRWEAYGGGVIYHVGVVFKQARNIAMTPLRVRERGDDPQRAMHNLVMLINDLKLAGVLKPSPERVGLYFDPEVEIPEEFQNRVSP